jgi:hypothetical protein
MVYIPDDTWLRKYVLLRLLAIARYNISQAKDSSGFASALDVCNIAKERVESWSMAAAYPEIYYNCGLLAAKTGNTSYAKTCLQKYLDLAPNGSNADKAKSLLSSL